MNKSAAVRRRPARPAPRRLTQAERSEAMRRRLLAATLEGLAEDGYAGTSLNTIARRAGVSRGAQTHHYPNKQALILDAAEDLLRRSYRTLGQVMLSIADEDNRLEALIHATWTQLFDTPMFGAYSELLTASQRDPQLAEALRKMLTRTRGVFEPAVDHYFEAAPGVKQDLPALFLQLSCLLSGIAAQAHLLRDEALIKAQLKLWIQLASTMLRARKGVRTGPPRPKSLDQPLGE
jgi:AcrR family transcriptional regulator